MDDRLAPRQLLALLFGGLLSPALQLLPRRSGEAGEAGWLSALPALPVLLLVGWGVLRLLAAQPEGTGLAGAFERVLGKPLGKLLTAVYLLWGLFCLAVCLRSYGQRFLSTNYRNVSLNAFILVLLGLTLWLAWGKLSAFARAGEVFFLILCLTVGLVLALAAFNAEAANVLPVWVEDIPAAAGAAVPTLGVLGHAVFGGFLAGSVRRWPGTGRRAAAWAAAFCGVVTAAQLVCMGTFGPALTARMEAPFFMAAKSVGLRGGFQRVEALVLAVWTLSDLVLAGVLTFACGAMLKQLLGLRRGRWTAPAAALAGGAGALWLLPGGFFLEQLAGGAAVWGGILLGLALPGLVAAVGNFSRRR